MRPVKRRMVLLKNIFKPLLLSSSTGRNAQAHYGRLDWAKDFRCSRRRGLRAQIRLVVQSIVPVGAQETAKFDAKKVTSRTCLPYAYAR